MRVESKPTGTLGMGKRKLKLRKQQKHANEFPDSSDENGATEAVPVCPHLTKSVSLSLVKKAIKNLGLTGECTNCKGGTENSKQVESVADTSETSEDVADYTVWLCLQCGNQGCDRNSKNKHALKHYDTPRSSAHHLVLNLTTFVIWCYGCDDEVQLDVSKKLSECVEFVKKQLDLASSQSQTGGKRGSQCKTPTDIDESRQPVPEKEENKTQGNKQNPAQTQLVLPKVKGLSNLGNTCFFNAVMQNLSQTPVLANILSEHGKKGFCLQLPGQLISMDTSDEDASRAASNEEELKLELSPLTIRLEDGGALTNSVMSFMTDMNNYAAKSPVITPSSLFGQVCKKAPRFKGFQQQDSHELLRYLLDGMKAEEIKRCQAGILKAFNVPHNTKHVDEETKAKVKEYGTQVKHTFVDSVFGGAFISTVQCEVCNVPSQILEPYLDISLPVTEEKTVRPGNLGRKQVKSTDCSTEAVDDLIASKPTGPSKHMKKKERKESKKKKGRKHGKKEGGDKADGGDERMDVQQLNGEEEEEGQEEAAQTGQGNECNGPVTANGITGDRSDTSADVLQGISAANSEQNLADGEDDDSDADIEDNDDGCRNSPVEGRSSNDLTNIVPSTDIAMGLRGGSSDALLSDSTHTHLENGSCSPDVAKVSGEDDFRTSSNDVSIVPNCDISNSQELRQIHSEPIEGASSDNRDLKETDITKKLLEGKVVSGMVEEITESLKGIQVSDVKTEEGPGPVRERKSLSFEEEEEVQNIANINKNTLSNSNPSLPSQSPKLSRSSSLRSSINTKSRSQVKMEARTEAMRSLAPARYQPDSHECSIQSCLNQFTAAELLTGANKFGCENCSNKAKQYKDGKQQVIYTSASKQCLIFRPPAVLTLHMKRFQQVGFSLRKVNRHVDFPLLLDIAPYCSVLSQGVQPGQQKVLYSLYGIVEHSGRLTGGHYTAFVKVRPKSSSGQVKTFVQQNIPQEAELDKLLIDNMEALERQGAVGGTEDEESLGSTPGKWYYISDSRVHETTEAKVLSCQAYLLFYERIY